MDTQLRLAIDIGASGGRHILGWLGNGIIELVEVYRFPNGMVKKDGSLCWDVDALFGEVITGLRKCAELKKIPASVGIDAWGVDFVLLDKNGYRMEPAVAYRDDRTIGVDGDVFRHVPEDELYARTGIQKQLFNTIFQLMALKMKTPDALNKAGCLLMMPDYFHYRLCGATKTEYTNATTTGLINAKSKQWDREVIERCGFPQSLFGNIAPAGTVLGSLSNEVIADVGFNCEVILPPTHDTASAFLSVPSETDDSVYISSGTWSLMGVELTAPVTTEASRAANFTNEGGYDYRFRFLKNIMGLWVLQSVLRESGEGVSFSESEKISRESDYNGIIDVNESRFFAPESMTETIRQACMEQGLAAPQSLGDLARCIYRSIASSYARTIKELRMLTGKDFSGVNIIGGGSKNLFLNELTADACGLPVYAGPAEGTALGNILSQMIAYGEIPCRAAARETVRRSFDVLEVRPFG